MTRSKQAVELELCEDVAKIAKVSPDQVHPRQSLGELGLDSLGFVALSQAIKNRFSVHISPEELFEHVDIRETAGRIVGETLPCEGQSSPRVFHETNPPTEPIAIVGASFRIPGAQDWDSLAKLQSKAPVFAPLPFQRWPADGTEQALADLSAGLIDNVDRFDASFFQISPREALAMDPQQRLLLETSWRALLDAGIQPQTWDGSNTSVFVGASSFDYAELLRRTSKARLSHIGTGLSHAILANRLSQYYNFCGSSETIDTACSSSLVALWRAVTELRSRAADSALVCGVNVFASDTPFRAFAAAGMLDPSGRCLPFDESAGGYVRGEGVIALVLKRMSDVTDHDESVLALVRGGAVAHGGRTHSLTAPNPRAQARVIQSAFKDAQVQAKDIGYLEAHGTGTSLGDPIEIRGLKQVFGEQESPSSSHDRCRISTIKAKIGHLEAAAGLAGVLHVLQTFRTERLPANSQVQTLNPLIDLRSSRLCIDQQSSPWKAREGTRLAGVSSFGFGGTNAHIVLQEAPAQYCRKSWSQPICRFERTRFWPTLDPESESSDLSMDVVCQVPSWNIRKLDSSLSSDCLDGKQSLIIVSGPNGRTVAQFLRESAPNTFWREIDWGQLGAKQWSTDYLIDLSALDDCFRAVGTVLQQESSTTSDGVESERGQQDSEFISKTGELVEGRRAAEHLHNLARGLGTELKRGKELRFLQVTHQLRRVEPAGLSCENLAGAAISSWYENLIGEYKNSRGQSIDFGGAEIQPDNIAKTVLAELQQTEIDRVVSYIGTKRWVRSWKPLRLSEERASFGKGIVALVTGGMGDIGSQLIDRLVQDSTVAILILGRRARDATIENKMSKWANSKVEVRYVQSGSLDREELRNALQDFEETYGDTTHVFHCAGVVDAETLSFYNKDRDSMVRVFEPKLNALSTVFQHLRERPPREVVLFSSTSASEPRQAAGMLDYSAANGFLEHFAAQRNHLEKTNFRVIQWGLWQSTTMAEALRQNGIRFTGIPTQVGLNLLSQVMSQPKDLTSIRVMSKSQHQGQAIPMRRSGGNRSIQHVSPTAEAVPHTLQDIRRIVRNIFAQELELTPGTLDEHASFQAMGVDSIVLLDVVAAIEKRFGRSIDPERLIRSDSTAQASEYLFHLNQDSESRNQHQESPNAHTSSIQRKDAGRRFPVAVIGLACQVPGAKDAQQFWTNLKRGIDSVGRIPVGTRCGVPGAQQNLTSRWAGLISGFEELHPRLYGVSKEDAKDIDPLVRLFTECGLTTVHNSCIGLERIKGRCVGVFAGARMGRYAERISSARKKSITGVGQNFISSYLSHILDLKGPNLVVDTACSSSLTAVHLACNSLRSGDCELAIAGGVDLILDEKTHEFLQSARALSPNGKCQPFSANANGFVPGEGVGSILLKPLDDALRDGDEILAVIEGSAINNDGETLGITTPGTEGQAEVIRRAYQASGLSPRDVSYIETHGTGTLIGDPIELRSLANAFKDELPDQCAVGSVKSNIGHLLCAAGISSFIKVVLSLHHRIIPPTLHCKSINPRIGFDKLPFYPITQAIPWTPRNGKRLAGVSGFGFGKTNVHIVLSDGPQDAVAGSIRCDSLPATLCGEKIRAWNDPISINHAGHAPLMSLHNLAVRSYERQHPE